MMLRACSDVSYEIEEVAQRYILHTPPAPVKHCHSLGV